MPMLLKLMEPTHPERNFRFECPACGAPCKLSMDKSFPGAKFFIETIFDVFGLQHIAQRAGVDMHAGDLLGAWSQEAEIQMPPCPQVLSPTEGTSLKWAWKLPEVPQTHPFLVFLRSVRATLT